MKKSKGQILVISILFLSVTVLLVSVVVSFFLGNDFFVQRRYEQKIAFNLAEAGIDWTINKVNNDPNFYHDTIDLSNGSFETTVSQISTNLKQIDTVGYYPNKTNAKVTRNLRVKLELNTTDITFRYGVQVGFGGLEMKNNSKIIGNIYSDGNINGSEGTYISGDAYVATGMTPDNNWLVYKADGIFGKDGVNDIAQSFRPNSSGKLSQIAFYLKKISNPSNKTIYIVTDNGGSPSKTVLAQTPLLTDRIGSTYSWVTFSFSNPPDLTAGTWYWIIIDAYSNPAQYFSIGKDTDGGNGNGVSMWSGDWNAANPIWTEDNGDFNFKTWIGGLPNYLNAMAVGGDAHANTITASQICGDAYYQSIDASSLTFLNTPTNPPCSVLTPGTAIPNSDDPPVEALPITDGNISDWKKEALQSGETYSDAAHCSPATDITLGPAKLECDFNPSGGITVTIGGTLWVRGNINIPVGTKIQLAPGYGESSGVIVADYPGFLETRGKVNIENNVYICGSTGYNPSLNKCNDPGNSYTLILSTHNSATTHAISIANNSDSAIFYSSAGSIYIAQNAKLKEATAYKLVLENNAVVNYVSGLANTNFTSGPGASWSLKSGTWQEL